MGVNLGLAWGAAVGSWKRLTPPAPTPGQHHCSLRLPPGPSRGHLGRSSHQKHQECEGSHASWHLPGRRQGRGLGFLQLPRWACPTSTAPLCDLTSPSWPAAALGTRAAGQKPLPGAWRGSGGASCPLPLKIPGRCPPPSLAAGGQPLTRTQDSLPPQGGVGGLGRGGVFLLCAWREGL